MVSVEPSLKHDASCSYTSASCIKPFPALTAVDLVVWLPVADVRWPWRCLVDQSLGTRTWGVRVGGSIDGKRTLTVGVIVLCLTEHSTQHSTTPRLGYNWISLQNVPISLSGGNCMVKRHPCAHNHTLLHTHTHTHIHRHTQALTHTHTSTSTHSHSSTSTHTHTHTLSLSPVSYTHLTLPTNVQV